MATDVTKNPEDAKIGASKRIRSALDSFRKIGNTAGWALSTEDREAMADAIEQGAVELVGKLRGTVASDSAEFSL